MHPAFPSPDDDDAEDVAWGLTTGAALWKQGERYDAIVWLKRAVDAAAQAGAGRRADELNRAATELLASLSGPSSSMLSVRPPPPPAARPSPLPPPGIAASSSAPPSASGAAHHAPAAAPAGPPPPPKAPPVRPRGAPPPPPPPRNPNAARREVSHFPPLPATPPARPSPLPRPRSTPVEEPDSRPNPALIDQAIREALAQPLVPAESAATEHLFQNAEPLREPFQTEVDEETEIGEEETIPLPSPPIVLDTPPPRETSSPSIDATPFPLSSPPAALSSSVPPAPPPPRVIPSRTSPLPPSGPPPRISSSRPPGQAAANTAPHRSSPVPAAPISMAPSAGALRSSPIPPAPAGALRSSPVPPAPSAAAALRSSPLPPAPSGTVRASQPPPHWGSSPAAPFKQSPLPPLPPSVAPPPISLDALGQLSPSQREELLKAATIESLGIEEEVTVSGLAFVIMGQASIQATVAEAAAGVLRQGELLYAKSPIAETVSLRLVAEAEPTQVALWDAKTAEDALSASPELLERLKIASARAQAIVGCSMGAMGERLDESLRTLAIERLETRILQPNEVIAAAGLPVPGMVIVGVGTVELDDDGGEPFSAKLVPGDFLFATEVLGAEAAPATARAGSRGAVVLFGPRAVAHELLVTCPPLLEIFAGM